MEPNLLIAQVPAKVSSIISNVSITSSHTHSGPLEEKNRQGKLSIYSIRKDLPSHHAENKVKRQLIITGEQGLHARPAASIAKIAIKFGDSAEIKLEVLDSQGKVSNSARGDSVMAMLMMAAGKGNRLMVTVRGAKATEAMDEIITALTKETDTKGTPVLSKYEIRSIKLKDMGLKIKKLDGEIGGGRKILLSVLEKDLKKKEAGGKITEGDIIALYKRFNTLFDYKGIRAEFYKAMNRLPPPPELNFKIKKNGNIVTFEITAGDKTIRINVENIHVNLHRKTDPHIRREPLVEVFDEVCSILNGNGAHKHLLEMMRYDSEVYKEAHKRALEAPYEEFEKYLVPLISLRDSCVHFDLWELK